VYSADVDGSLPVVVYIHGGGLIGHDSRYEIYGPELYMDHDVVLVTLNYRLSSLGFLSLGTEDVPGNQGFMDQQMALKWVADNIAAFGGDPESVTLVGQSAGAWSAYYHIFSPGSFGLLHKIILHSGVLDFSPAFRSLSAEDAKLAGRTMALAAGCDSDDDDEIAVCLRSLGWQELLDAGSATNNADHPLFPIPSTMKGYSGVIDAGANECLTRNVSYRILRCRISK